MSYGRCYNTEALDAHLRVIDAEAEQDAYEEKIWETLYQELLEARDKGVIDSWHYDIIVKAVEKAGEIPQHEGDF